MESKNRNRTTLRNMFYLKGTKYIFKTYLKEIGIYESTGKKFRLTVIKISSELEEKKK
jgi:hypothetical protein